MNDSDLEDEHGIGTFFEVIVEEIQSGKRLPRTHLQTWDEVAARKTYHELVERGYQVRLIKEVREFWKLEQTKDFGKV